MRARGLKTITELVAIYRFKDSRQCLQWLVDRKVPHQRPGRVWLFDTHDIDLAFNDAVDKYIVRMTA